MPYTALFRPLLSVPKFDVAQTWNDNTRASFATLLVACEMVFNSFWYALGYGWTHWFESRAPQAIEMDYAILVMMGGASVAVLIFTIIMHRVFLVITAKTPLWYVCQATHIGIYLVYCTLFTQFFGENTIVIGLNLSGGVILGLLLLDRTLMLIAFALSIASFVLIGINRQTQWLPLDTIYAKNDSSDYGFWVFSHMYFAVTKVVVTILAVDWILKVLKYQQTKIHELSQRDALTGLYNRRALYCYLRFIWFKQLQCHCLSLIYFDLDNFKIINDKYGHQAGDNALVNVSVWVSGVLQQQLSTSYHFGRLGGEEFAIALPHIALEDALTLAEMLRQTLTQHPLTTHSVNQSFVVTASFGVASLIDPKFDSHNATNSYQFDCQGFEDYLKNDLQISPALPLTIQTLINIASDATRTAKQQGRNRVVSGGIRFVTQSPLDEALADDFMKAF